MTAGGISPDQALALLDWYAEAGVDVALEAAPVDRFAAAARYKARLEEARAAPPPPPPPQKPRREAPRPPAVSLAPDTRATGDKAVQDAREAARGADSIEALEKILATFEGCGLKATAKNLCVADGNPASRLMFIGEAPGRDEDIQGKPFVGRAGQLLDRMLAAAGMDRTSVYITNTVFWRPPGNRNPNPVELAVCRPFTERQIELVAPDVLVFLGGVAAKHMLQTSEGIMRLRGKWRTFDTGGRQIPVMATLHPSYLLRQPLQKRLAWRDFLEVKKKLAET